MVPIAKRQSPSKIKVAVRIVLIFFFLAPTMFVEMVLVVLSMPLQLVSPVTFQRILRACKSLFSLLLAHMFSCFAPSQIVISFGDLDGNFVDANRFAEHDADGRVVGLRFPTAGIWIGNHQIYTDWVYMWCVDILMTTGFSPSMPTSKETSILSSRSPCEKFRYWAISWACSTLFSSRGNGSKIRCACARPLAPSWRQERPKWPFSCTPRAPTCPRTPSAKVRPTHRRIISPCCKMCYSHTQLGCTFARNLFKTRSRTPISWYVAN